MRSTNDRGSEGEDKAAEYLRSLGYTIVTRNAHSRRGEIDIVALDGDVLVFVEVKLRRSGVTEESVTPGKAQKLREAAKDYLRSVGETERFFRFDLIAIDSSELRHHRDVLNY